VDRRAFLRRAGLITGGLAVGASATSAIEERRLDTTITAAGHAVGADRPAGLRATTLTYRVITPEHVVALTFDDGPSTRYTSKILDILDAKDVSATLFLIGKHAHALPELAKRAADRHEIGNHTWSHPNMGLFHAPDAQHELTRAADAISTAIGRAPTLFRPPYGAFSGATAMIATGMSYPMVMWDEEFNQHGPSGAENSARLAAGAGAGSIILGHDGGTLNCDMVVAGLPMLIDALRAKGYTFATVSGLLALAEPLSAPVAAPRSTSAQTRGAGAGKTP
jgi:peptidoglycan/xylan/chitin deacetylase (PgdA/CDA1 family)